MSPDRRRIAGLLALPALVVVGLCLAVPVGFLVRWSLASPDLLAPFGGAPRLSSFAALAEPPFPEALLRTARVSLLATLLASLLAFPAAVCLARSRGVGRRLLTLLVVAPLLTSAVARASGWSLILGPEGLVGGAFAAPRGLLGTEAAVVIGLTDCFLPFLILILLRSLERLDPDLLEAARGLGASPAQALARVILPFALPGLLVGGGFVLAGCLSALAAPAVLGGAGSSTVVMEILERARFPLDWPSAAAASLALLALVAAILGAAAALARRRARVFGP